MLLDAPGSGFSSGWAFLKGEAKQLGEEVKLAEVRPAGADVAGKIKILFYLAEIMAST